MTTPEEEALSDLLRAVGEVSEGIGEAIEALGQLPRYPISKAAQLARFGSAWDANTAMLAAQAAMFEFLRVHGYRYE